MRIVLKIIGFVILVLFLLLLGVVLYASSKGERIIESTDHDLVQ